MNASSQNSQEQKLKTDLRVAARAWLSKANVPVGLQQWVSFHHSPILQMHPTRWGNTPPIWRTHILRSSYASAYLEENFRHHWHWRVGPWTSFQDPLMRLVISSHQYLERLATLLGVLIAAEKIRKAVDGKTVRLLREKLGPDLLNFARLKAPQLNVTIPEKCQIKEWHPEHAAIILLEAGWLLVTCASGLLPVQEWRRFLSRVPKKIEGTWNQQRFSAEDFQLSWQCVRTLISVTKEKK
ncbi:MAG: hypothetical protein C5B47_05600 [Verrucomicrobia bacterium]|nr:MAG: hypothetical protein C5B47_05600 [Verrucomicrobiota bacterium]